MKSFAASAVITLMVAIPVMSQEAMPTAVPPDIGSATIFDASTAETSSSQGELFPNFIGFLSNPVQSIDPRSLTQIWPVFGSTWVSPSSRLPDGNVQIYGAGLNVAVTERFSIGFNQGGYATSHFDRRNPNKGNRDGWLDLGGFAQYSIIADVENQFLLTGGLRFAAPTGEAEVFQGHGPVDLSPYLTVGKELGRFHVLATVGYQFPVSGARNRLENLYANAHFDYQLCSWLYPVVEINSSFLTNEFGGGGLDRGRGFFDLGNFDSTGNVVAVSAGANFVIVRNRLEFGAVYNTSVATQRDFNFDGLLVKMVMRF